MSAPAVARARAWLALTALLAGCAGANPGSADSTGSAPDPARIARDVAWLADDAREGRGVGTPGIAAAAEYLAHGFAAAGFAPGGDDGTFFQHFEMPVAIGVERATLALGREPLERDRDFEAFLSSANGSARSEPVFAGYGISAPELGYDDYAGIDVRGRIVLVLDDRPAGDKSRLRGPEGAALLRRARKVAIARRRGAVAVLIAPAGPSDRLPGNAGRDWANPTQQASALPVLAISWDAAQRIVAAARGPSLAERKRGIDEQEKPASELLAGVELSLEVAIERRVAKEANVIAILAGSDPALAREAVVIGAHYDHLGRGDFGSLAPDRRGQIHNGADDNASGSAGLLELARAFAGAKPRRTLVLAAFSGEEAGLVGSRAYVEHPPIPIADTVAMLNLDMVGRLREGRLLVMGTESSPGFADLVRAAADEASIGVNLTQGALAPSDQTSFLAQDVPVIVFFTGTHPQYHTPDDDSALIDSAGEAHVLALVAGSARRLLAADVRPVKSPLQATHGAGGGEPGYGPYLGTIPDFGGASGEGVLIQGVRAGSPADLAGLRGGDRIVEFDGVPVANLEEYAALLFGAHADQRVPIVVLRDGQRIRVEAVLGQRH
jgi:hypothetical protein